MRALAKLLYDDADATLENLIRAWKKDRKATIASCDYASLPEKLAKFVASLTDKEPTSDAEHCLEIDDLFRGQTKAFAPGFAHRYKLKLQKANED